MTATNDTAKLLYILEASFSVINANNITVDSFFTLKDYSTSRMIQNNFDNFNQRIRFSFNSRIPISVTQTVEDGIRFPIKRIDSFQSLLTHLDLFRFSNWLKFSWKEERVLCYRFCGFTKLIFQLWVHPHFLNHKSEKWNLKICNCFFSLATFSFVWRLAFFGKKELWLLRNS